MTEKRSKPSEWAELRRKNQEEMDRRKEELIKEQELLEAKPHIDRIMEWFHEPAELKAYFNHFPNDRKIDKAISLMKTEETYKNKLAEIENAESISILENYQFEVSKYRLEKLTEFVDSLDQEEILNKQKEVERIITSDPSLRQQTFILLILIFGKLEIPTAKEDLRTQIIDVIHFVTGKDRQNVKKLLNSPTAYKIGSNQSKERILKDLRTARKHLRSIDSKKAELITSEAREILNFEVEELEE